MLNVKTDNYPIFIFMITFTALLYILINKLFFKKNSLESKLDNFKLGSL